ncbi:MAG: M14 family metallopeptidase [bacterium]
MTSPRLRAAILLLMGGLLAGAGPASAQTGSYDDYLDYDGLTRLLRSVEDSRAASLEILGRTAEGREVWLVTLSGRGEADAKPAMLVTANLEANHLIGSMTALYLADHLASRYGSDQAVTDLLDRRTVYVIPRLNPDGAEWFFTRPGLEMPFKPDPEDEDRDGEADEDGGDDLNGDGLVTMMRVRDPEGVWMSDPDDERLMKRADRSRGERGTYTLYTEGIDDDGDGEYNEDGPGGTHLNMNWPHEYPFYQDHAGPHQVSEVETRALADFTFTHPNITLFLTFSPYDNLLQVPQGTRERQAQVNIPEGMEIPPGVSMEEVRNYFRQQSAPSGILSQDADYLAWFSDEFDEITGLSGSGASGARGAWHDFAYFQLGRISLTTPVWTLPRGAEETGPRGRPTARGPSSDEKAWLAWFEAAGVDGFVGWTPVDHPQLGQVEVGGFVPNIRTNPPPAEIAELARKHAEFAVWAGDQLPSVELLETAAETRGDGIFLVKAVVVNEGYLPTATAMGLRSRTAPPVTLRLEPGDFDVLTGNIQDQVRNLQGSGGRSTVEWLVKAPAGTRIQLTVLAPQAGGTITRTITLR